MKKPMNNMRVAPLIALALLLAAQPALAGDYAEAKALADRDEAALDKMSAAYLHDAQAKAVDAIVQACATPDADTAPFTVVARLDENGKAVETWRDGDTPLAVCFEQQLSNRVVAAPPHAPFHVSFEMSFTP